MRFPRAAIPDGIGSAVFNARRERGWTQQRLADKAGLQRETIVRLENGDRMPAGDTIFRLEAALGPLPGGLVPAWPEWSPVGTAVPGPRSRERRRALGLSISEVAAAAGVSPATICRFELEIGSSPSLTRSQIRDGMIEILALTNVGFADVLGFADPAEHFSYCLRGA